MQAALCDVIPARLARLPSTQFSHSEYRSSKPPQTSFVAEEQAFADVGPDQGTASLQNRLCTHQRQADQPSGSRLGCELLLPVPSPLGIRVEGANGPTNARAGGIRLVEGKARPDFDPLSFVCLTGENVRFF